MLSVNHLRQPSSIFRWEIILLLGMVAVSLAQVNAAQINARSPALADVSSAVTLAKDGDTVVIPAGTATWTSTLTVPAKGISILGAGLSQRDQTIINFPSKITAINLSMPVGKNLVLGGITLVKSDTLGVSHWIDVSGADTHNTCSYGLRIHHVSFEGGTASAPVKGFTIYFSGSTCGVVDHCFWGPGVQGETSHTTHATWGGGTLGNKSLSAPSSFGSNAAQAIFWEDNIVECVNYGFDNDTGGRSVSRHNLFWGQDVAGHGLDSGGSIRGCNSVVAHNNIIRKQRLDGSASAGPNPFTNRGGSRRFFNNYCVGTYNTLLQFYNYRMGEPATNSNGPWLGSNGRNPWDYNDRADHTNTTTVTINGSNYTFIGNGVTLGVTPGSSIPSDARFGAIYASGTYSGPNFAGGEGTITFTGNSLQAPNPNCWQFYTLINKSLNANTDTRTTNNYTVITGNTAKDVSGNTKLSVSYVGGGKISTHFQLSTGNEWEIRHVIRALDQPSAGYCHSVIGGSGTNQYLETVNQTSEGQVVSKPGWAAQDIDGTYAWNNKMMTEAQNAANPAWRTAGGWASAPDGLINPTGSPQDLKVSSNANPAAQIINRVHFFNSASGDYNWNPDTPAGTAHPETRVGPDDDAVNFAWGGHPPAGYIPSFYVNGSGGYTYPHPLTSSLQPPTNLTITSTP